MSTSGVVRLFLLPLLALVCAVPAWGAGGRGLVGGANASVGGAASASNKARGALGGAAAAQGAGKSATSGKK